MDEVDLSVKDSEYQKRRSARSRMIEAIRSGEVISMEDAVRARGLVVRQRNNSIFSDAWIPLAFIILVVGLIANRNAAVLAVGVGLFVVVALSTWYRRLSLVGVTYVRSFDKNHIFPNELLTMTLTIGNNKPLPLTWLQFKDEAPIAPIDQEQIAVMASEIRGSYVLENTFSMNAFERTRRTINFKFPNRGYYNFGPVRYLSGDIFTLFTVERAYSYRETIVVYPNVYPLETLQLPAKELFGEIKIRRSLFSDPIKVQGIRDYQPQDRFRDVHWKATARKGNLQTKVYDPTSSMTVVTFLNVATYPKHWMGFDPNLLDRVISVTASIANYAMEQKWGVGLCANGSIPGSDQPIRVAPGRSPDQLLHILEALAAVTEFATGSIELLLYRESRKLPWAATFILVTAVVTEDMLVSLVRLKEAGRRVTLISLADEPPPRDLQGVLTYHVPSSLPTFQSHITSRSETEMALSSISTKEFEPQESDDIKYNDRRF